MTAKSRCRDRRRGEKGQDGFWAGLGLLDFSGRKADEERVVVGEKSGVVCGSTAVEAQNGAVWGGGKEKGRLWWPSSSR